MEIDIEKFAEDGGKKIADAIASKYGEDPVVKHKSFLGSFFDGFLGGGLSRLKVEKEIYDRSLHEWKRDISKLHLFSRQILRLRFSRKTPLPREATYRKFLSQL